MSAPLAIVQNAYVVANLERACDRINQLFGVGPFVGGGKGVLAEHSYRGHPAEPIRIRGVFVQSGKLNIELIELLSNAPSAFHDMFGGDRQKACTTAQSSPPSTKPQNSGSSSKAIPWRASSRSRAAASAMWIRGRCSAT